MGFFFFSFRVELILQFLKKTTHAHYGSQLDEQNIKIYGHHQGIARVISADRIINTSACGKLMITMASEDYACLAEAA